MTGGVYACVYASLHVCMGVSMYGDDLMYGWMDVRMDGCVYMCTPAYDSMYIGMYMYVCMYLYVYIYPMCVYPSLYGCLHV